MAWLSWPVGKFINKAWVTKELKLRTLEFWADFWAKQGWDTNCARAIDRNSSAKRLWQRIFRNNRGHHVFAKCRQSPTSDRAVRRSPVWLVFGQAVRRPRRYGDIIPLPDGNLNRMAINIPVHGLMIIPQVMASPNWFNPPTLTETWFHMFYMGC